ncbi:hypothetical protein JCGZ_22887 [Jatropha curcas]|uniref:Uncharacterized protein n=1 Tax=Jatropha curcas TaxID=180498 RepID=A0A067JPQ3_JATCU|nr:hypothetical protein JCGZ_22887 [Jatropha curcas]
MDQGSLAPFISFTGGYRKDPLTLILISSFGVPPSCSTASFANSLAGTLANALAPQLEPNDNTKHS